MVSTVIQLAAVRVSFVCGAFASHLRFFRPQQIHHIIYCVFTAVIQELLFNLTAGDMDNVLPLLDGEDIFCYEELTCRLHSLNIPKHDLKLSNNRHRCRTPHLAFVLNALHVLSRTRTHSV